jgi:hypothetical protein
VVLKQLSTGTNAGVGPSGQRSEVQVRLPVLPDFLRSSGSGTGSTQPREYSLFGEVGTNFANKRQSLGRYSSLAEFSFTVFWYATSSRLV